MTRPVRTCGAGCKKVWHDDPEAVSESDSLIDEEPHVRCPGVGTFTPSGCQVICLAISVILLSPMCLFTSFVVLTRPIAECDNGNWSLWTKCFRGNDSCDDHCENYLEAPGFIHAARFGLILLVIMRSLEVMSIVLFCFYSSWFWRCCKVLMEFLTGMYAITLSYLFIHDYPSYLSEELTGCGIGTEPWIQAWPYVCLPCQAIISLSWVLYMACLVADWFDEQDEIARYEYFLTSKADYIASLDTALYMEDAERGGKNLSVEDSRAETTVEGLEIFVRLEDSSGHPQSFDGVLLSQDNGRSYEGVLEDTDHDGSFDGALDTDTSGSADGLLVADETNDRDSGTNQSFDDDTGSQGFNPSVNSNYRNAENEDGAAVNMFEGSKTFSEVDYDYSTDVEEDFEVSGDGISKSGDVTFVEGRSILINEHSADTAL